MRPRLRFALLPAGLLAVSLPSTGSAQVSPTYGNPGMYWSVEPYLWFANLDATIDIGDVGLVVGDSTELKASFAGDVQVGKGRFRGIATFSTSSLGNSTELLGDAPPGTVVDYDFSWTTAELFAAWQVGTFGPGHALSLLGGLRYVRQHLELSGGPEPETTETWVEPVLGAEYYVEMGGPFWAAIAGSVGGIAFGSTFAWQLGGHLGAHIAGPVHAAMAVDYYQTEYENESSGYRLDEGVSQGWYFGILIRR